MSQLTVELKVAMAKVREEARAAGRIYAEELKKAMSGVQFSKPTSASDDMAKGSKKAADAANEHAKAVKGVSSALKEQLAAWRAANPGGVSPGQQVSIYNPNLRNPSPGPQGPIPVGPLTGGGLATQAPSYLGPTPPVLPRPSGGGGGQGGSVQTIGSMIQGFMNKPIGSTGASIAGLFAGLAGLRVAIGLVTYAFRTLLAPLHAMLSLVMKAAEDARHTYAKSLQSGGMPIGFTVQRGALADVLGVGEHDVWQYAAAIKAVNEDMRYSTQTLSENNRALTALGWEWKVLEFDMKALGSQLATDFIPIVHQLFNVMHAGLMNLIAAARLFQNTAEYKVGVVLAKLMGFSEAPTTGASARRLPPSQMERMGLVLGLGGGNTPAHQTAKNTAKTASLLENVVKVLWGMATQNSAYKKLYGEGKP
jgi:hypothetical protein